ncbi:DUF805 domain-containing protein [Litorimonas cladophorae]|uniref:DUF805 domain-containing protein n=1 Tax=Litorimonas cladophorae TaxID=1220491 RepID=A0A918KNW7_9PROT|nr:DUF805 domain-containing protein [Litorimonas cladophorae]GGX70949.1 DUF805 domain-containing protein [Litorimonas cladophorae]
MLDFGTAVRSYYRNYTNADGRAQRSAYWWVLLFQLIIYGVLATVVYMSDGFSDWYQMIKNAAEGGTPDFGVQLGISGNLALTLGVFFAIGNFLPQIMLEIRRFHDLGQSGWLVLVFRILGVLPVVGNIAGLVNIIWFIFPGTVGGNRYGPDPLRKDPDVFG